MASVKGKLFEFFVYKLLLFSGFKPVVPDKLLVFKGPAGTMLQGMGQAHNADVLLEPPFQTPLYFPTRLLVECKCYNDTIGLPVVRNAFGLREDVNNFDIVTEDILKNRRSSYTTKATYHPMKRYTYQVAVASLTGFKSTAIPFAQAHRIPLISFAESIFFEEIRNVIEEVENDAIENEELSKKILEYLKEQQYETYINCDCYYIGESFYYFLKAIEWFRDKIVIGLLEDGTILFMVKEKYNYDGLRSTKQIRYDDGCEIDWSNTSKAWKLYDREQCYSFELPKEIYQEWIESAEERRKAALDIKQQYFSKIVLFENNMEMGEKVRTIHLSQSFIEDASKLMQ